MRSATKARLSLLATVLVWGATFTLVKGALADVSPLLFNLLRFALAAGVLAALHAGDLRRATGAQWKAGAFAGFFLATGYQLQTLGLARTTPAKSAFLTGLVVVVVPALTLIRKLRPEGSVRPGIAAALGALFAFAGLVLLTVPRGASLAAMQVGDLLSIMCAVAFAAHILTLAHLARLVPAGLFATLQLICCTGVMLVSLPLEPEPHLHVTGRLVGTLLVCALFATAAAFTVQSFAQQHLPPTQTVLLLALEPVFAALTSLVVLHETLTGRALAGAALILCGILLTELLPSARASEIPA